MAPPLPAARPDRVFAHPDYALFWASRFASTLGVMVEGVTLGWQVYDVARHTQTVAESAFMVGMIGLAQFLPLFALTLVAGAVADHFDRKKIYMACLASEVVCVGVLIWISHMAQPPLWGIFAIAVLFGAIRSFQSPAMSALAPMLVPRALLPRAIALGSLAWQTGAILGPWLGGVLVATSSATAYAAAGGLYVISALAMSQIRASTQPQRQGGGRVAMVREGLDYVWANKIVLGAISLDLVAVLLGGATALLPVYARDILHVGAGGFGVLRSGPAIGACVCAFVLGRRPLTRRAGLWMFGAVALFGLATSGSRLGFRRLGRPDRRQIVADALKTILGRGALGRRQHRHAAADQAHQDGVRRDIAGRFAGCPGDLRGLHCRLGNCAFGQPFAHAPQQPHAEPDRLTGLEFAHDRHEPRRVERAGSDGRHGAETAGRRHGLAVLHLGLLLGDPRVGLRRIYVGERLVNQVLVLGAGEALDRVIARHRRHVRPRARDGVERRHHRIVQPERSAGHVQARRRAERCRLGRAGRHASGRLARVQSGVEGVLAFGEYRHQGCATASGSKAVASRLR